MFGSPVLEVILALVGAYAGLGVISSSLCEWLASWRRWRPSMLESGIRALLANAQSADGTEFAERFFEGPFIQPLGRSAHSPNDRGSGGAGPPYIPPRAFTLTILELIQPPEWQGEPLTFNDFARMVERLPDNDFKKALQAISRSSNHDIDLVRRNLDVWFEQVMVSVSSLYRRRLWAASLVVSALLCCGLGVDTLAIIGTVWGESLRREEPRATVVIAPVREAILQNSGMPVAAKDETPEKPRALVTVPTLPASVPSSAQHAARPVSAWGTSWQVIAQLLPHILGLFLSTIAVAISAPLGFDLLNRFTNVRLGSPPPLPQRRANPTENGGDASTGRTFTKKEAVLPKPLDPEGKRGCKEEIDL